MKKTFIVLCCSALAVACGGSGTSSTTEKKDTAAATATTPATTTPASPADEKALELIGSSDCTTCHRLHATDNGSVIGPAYSQVAGKYPNAADTTINRLVQKIIKGGTGVWGQVPMTPHPALAEADVKEMVKYILSLKN